MEQCIVFRIFALLLQGLQLQILDVDQVGDRYYVESHGPKGINESQVYDFDEILQVLGRDLLLDALIEPVQLAP